jgi:hypothetical protein
MSTDLPERKPCYELCKTLFASLCLTTAELIILSRTLTTADVILMGQ